MQAQKKRKGKNMSEAYPLYPELQEEAKIQAQVLMDVFKNKMHKLSEEILGDLYCDVSAYIETDQWTNFRNELLDGLCNYPNSKIRAAYDFKKIRQSILKEYREEIISDLNQDMVKEVDDLKKQLQIEREMRQY